MREVPLNELDFRSIIRPGDVVLWGPGAAEPTPLVEALVEQRKSLGGISVILGISPAGTIKPNHTDYIKFSSTVGHGAARAIATAGLLDILPIHASEFSTLLRSGKLRADVVLAQLSCDHAGQPNSFGVADLYMGSALSSARAVIVEANELAPWTYNREPPDLGKVDASGNRCVSGHLLLMRSERA